MPIKKIQVVSCGFNFVFDHAETAFRIRNDGSAYTIAELQWSYLSEYEVYNFTYKEIKTVEVETMKETETVDAIVFSFDVSVDGKFVSLRYLLNLSLAYLNSRRLPIKS